MKGFARGLVLKQMQKETQGWPIPVRPGNSGWKATLWICHCKFLFLIVIFILLNGSYMMEKVDLVLVGAEGVVESGGIINKVSDQISLFSLVTSSCVNLFPEDTNDHGITFIIFSLLILLFTLHNKHITLSVLLLSNKVVLLTSIMLQFNFAENNNKRNWN